MSKDDLEVTLYLDGNPDVKTVAFQEQEISTLKARVKELEWNCADLQKHNDSLMERVKKLAMQRPKGYNPSRRFGNRGGNKKFNGKKG